MFTVQMLSNFQGQCETKTRIKCILTSVLIHILRVLILLSKETIDMQSTLTMT